ncbi:MAG: hypothetical protein JEZ07_12210 [Phycisphaerae bacterium]|nr:hypothetical protein [Phycisphaerae bacterium]
MGKFRTTRNYDMFEVASALQKAIRRGDARFAGYWAIELFESGYREYAWRRLLVISAEDCWGLITKEIKALYECWQMADKKRKGTGRVFLSKATVLLAMCRKSRDADHLTNIVYDLQRVTNEDIDRELENERQELKEIPDYALDMHTRRGKKKGMTKEQFMIQEFEALDPRQPGLFDDDIK